MESQRPNSREDGAIWLLPEMKENRSEPVVEMRNETDTDFVRGYVFFPLSGEDPTIFEGSLMYSWPRKNGSLMYVSSLPSEPSTVTVVIEQHPKVPKRERVFHGRESDNNTIDLPEGFKSMRMDIGLQLQTPPWENEPSSGLKYKLIEQEHGPNKDLNLLRAAYLSMKANVSRSNADFIVPNNDMYKQRTPLGNTVLHLAAAYGDNAMVEKIAQHAAHLFTAINNNYDTALHVAARSGHGSTIQILLNSFLLFVRREASGHDHQAVMEMMLMVSLTSFRNKQGNTFFHEAFMVNGHIGTMIFQAFQAPFITDISESEANFKGIVNHLAPFAINEEGKSLLYLAIEVDCKQVVNQLMDICIEYDLQPQGITLLLPALNKRNKNMLDTILNKKPNWIHLRKENGRLPLHHAASMGYLEGVSHLVEKCASCTMERDNNGFFPIHWACSKGHVNVVQELLKNCPDPMEMIDDNGRNLLHIASESGKYEIVRYILQQPKLEIMINQKDNNGNTPLHLATLHWHPEIVLALTWDNRVNLALLNHQNQTALDMAALIMNGQNPSFAQQLTWAALQSARTPRNSVRFYSKDKNVGGDKEAPNTEKYKDRVDSLIVVSTLIITASFAAGFTVLGDVDQGVPVMLNHHMFLLFILSLSISLYSAIGTTIILMWARLGDLNLALFALRCARPLLGFSLTTLSVAFLAGVYLVLSKLSWLATIFLVMSVVLILKVVLLYILLWLPFSSTLPFIRYISYYPFRFLAKISEGITDATHQGSTFCTSYFY